MNHLKKITYGIDLFMMQLLVKGEDSIELTLPRALLGVYQAAAMNANTEIACYPIEDNEHLFSLEFKSPEEQNKLWDFFYNFNHSNSRAYPLPNFYDQESGELLIDKINEFTKKALLELVA